MIERLPYHHLFAESLRGSQSAPHDEVRSIVLVAYPPDFVKITDQIYPHRLSCDGAALVFAFPHVCVSTVALGGAPSVVANWNL